MGNAPSSQSQSSRSIRSRISGKERDLRDGPSIGRLSHVVSFYETPPGSLKAGRHTPGPETPAADVTEAKPEPAAIQDPDWDRLAKQLKWKPGVYTIVNAQSGTVVDLSGADNKSVIGFPQHNGKNQQWRFAPSGGGYTIQSVSSGEYLTLDSISDGGALRMSPFPVAWRVDSGNEENELLVRILWPNEKYALELADFGNPAPGTKVQLVSYKPEQACQLWRMIEQQVDSTSEDMRYEATSTTAPSEALVISEDKDAVTTTRTTTTVTTVTTVTKTPRPET
ncbi:hypothetical protein PHLCEN_2v9770 [Hermanssonia centrifuga]|uniref:Ricin B lectin domain-containing protein n=1 Tax=Hermanssonia centrifuga TaxID=98765 RepID=A0A2R6NQ26_9APHY|nr:hypothetical protein PHLCEN_2v9770 [Hermanssonia centrifuga]